MREELFASGRNIPNIDPYLNIWHWQIPIYLFLGGVAAGILFFAGIFTILGKEHKMTATVKKAPLLVPFLLVFGLFMLFLDLKHKLFFWQLYTTIRLESPMGWGAWVLMIITPISILWSASYIREIFPNWDWKFDFLKTFETWLIKYRLWIAWPMAIYAVILGYLYRDFTFGIQRTTIMEYLHSGASVSGFRDVDSSGCNYHAQ